MNIEYLKYALEIAKTRSINKASENLFISQPNLSRMIKKLEDEVGITIFTRTQTGIQTTIQGEEFLTHAEAILDEMNKIMEIPATSLEEQKFSISVPKAQYISKAFMSFVSKLDMKRELSVDYKESSSIGAMDNILVNNFNLGIIRYDEDFESFFEMVLREKGLVKRELRVFNYYVAFSKNSSLAKKQFLKLSDFDDYIEITHGESYIPNFDKNAIEGEYFNTKKKLRVYDSMGQLQMLKAIPNSFMLVFPLDDEIKNKYDLVQREILDFNKVCHDVLIHKKNYALTKIDRLFIKELESNIME